VVKTVGKVVRAIVYAAKGTGQLVVERCFEGTLTKRRKARGRVRGRRPEVVYDLVIFDHERAGPMGLQLTHALERPKESMPILTDAAQLVAAAVEETHAPGGADALKVRVVE